MRKDQKGFTIVELIIAIAIMSIVLAAVCGFIIVGSRNYAAANSDITIQQEAQLALNQMSDVLIDTTRSINYVGYDASGSPAFALKDSEFAFEPGDKALIMYNGEATVKHNPDGTIKYNPDGTLDTDVGEGNGNKNYQFLWNRADEALYYAEIPVAEKTFPGTDGYVVLAEHVTDFSIDLSQVEEKRVVMISMTFEFGGREYTTSNNVTVRNKVSINDAEIGALDKSVTLKVIPKKTSVILEPGEDYHFSTPKVSGTNILDKSVKWSIEGKGSGDPLEGGSTAAGSAFADTDNGILHISADEKEQSFNVIITTNAKDSDGNRAAAKVTVYVKRANDVSVSYGAASPTPLDELAAGSEFTVSANVSGNKLGDACDGTGCTWDISKDHDIVSWTVLQGPVELVSGGAKEASFKVKADAQSGDKIAIMATSAISRGIYNNYDESVRSEIESKFGYHFTSRNVVGYYEFEVSDYSPGNIIPLSGDFVYGTDNKQLFDYMYDGLSTELQNGRRVVFVRVREGSINADKSNDRIAAYYSTGANVRFFPDQFGLDINKSYYVMMQIIDPMPAEIRDKNANDRLPGEYQDASDDEIRAELLNEANFDRSGKYIGTKFHSGDMYYGTLNPPNIIVTYEGKSFPNNNGDYVSYSIAGGGDTIMNKFGVSDIVNIFDEIRDDRDRMQFTIYQGTSADPATWQRIYGVDLSSGDPVLINGSTVERPNNLAYSGENPFAKGWISVSPQGQSNTIRMNGNSSVSQSKLDACGTYYIVPGFAYANNPHVRDYEYIIEPTGEMDFELHYYEQKYAAIPLVISSGLTMEIIDNIKNVNGFINFPLPSSKDSLFTTTGEERMKSNLSFNVVDKNLNSKNWISGVSAKCIYYPAENRYKVTVYTVEMKNGKQIIHNYGVYACEPDGKVWTMLEAASDKTREVNATLKISDNISNKYGAIEFPLPSAADFPFSNTTGEQIKTGLSFDFYNESATALNGIFETDAKCSYNASTNEYELTLYSMSGKYIDEITHIYGVYKCKANGTEWTRKDGPSDSTAVRVNTGSFVSGSGSDTYETYLYAPDDPMFSEEMWRGGFKLTPKKNGSVSINLPVRKTNGDKGTISYTMKYSYNSSTDTHTLILNRVISWSPKTEENISFHWDAAANKWVSDGRTTEEVN